MKPSTTISCPRDEVYERLGARGGAAILFSSVLLLQMIGWSFLLSHNLARAERALAERPASKHSLAVGTDWWWYKDYYRMYPKRFGDITQKNFLTQFHKRPLYGPISAILSIVLYSVLGIAYPMSMYLILPFYSGLASLLFYVLLRRSRLPRPHAGLLTAICSLSFAWLSVFSVPESYSLTVLGVVICMLSASSFAHATHLAPRAASRHAVVVGVGACLYPPICGAVLLIVPALRTPREWLTILLPCTAIAVLIGALPNLVLQTMPDSISHAKGWVSLAGFKDIQLMLSVVLAFLFFSLVSPVSIDFVYAKPTLDLVHVLNHWKTVGVIVLLGLSFGFLLRHADWRRMSGIAMWFVCLIAFYILYNPKEVMLYTPLAVTLLCYMVALALSSGFCRDIRGAAGLQTKAIWGLAVALVTMVLLNARPILGV